MPPRYSYWTILADGLPTAFRAGEQADLLPTFNRIKQKHPDAQMKWFARGRLWESPEEAQADLQRARVRREREWRPGGEHRDPRQAFKNKRQREAVRAEREPRQAPSNPAASSAHPSRPSKPTGPAMQHARPRSKPAAPSTRPAKPAGPAAWRPSKFAASNTRPRQPARKRHR